MKTADGSCHYCYTDQSVADSDHQVIVATDLNNTAVDVQQLAPMIENTAETLGQLPSQWAIDAGYCPAGNLEHVRQIEADNDGSTEFFIATGGLKHGEQVPDAPRGWIPNNATAEERMARKLKTKRGQAVYARRKAIIEPVFGQIHTRQGNHVLLRGLEAAKQEWNLIAGCHNLLKLFKYHTAAATAGA